MSVIPKPAVCNYVPQASSMFEDHSRILRISTSKIWLIHSPFVCTFLQLSALQEIAH